MGATSLSLYNRRGVMRLFYIFLVVFLCVHAGAARAERIELKNGDRISGKWLDASETEVRFASQFGSVMRIPRDQIAGLYNDAGVAMALPSATQTALPEPKKLETAQAKPAKPEDEPGLFGAKWKSKANAGFGLQTGNSDTKSLNADFETRAKWDRDRANLDIDYNWQESEGERTQDNREIAGNYDRFLPASWLGDEKWYINHNASFRQDSVADLDLRSVLGIGLGRQFYETEDTYLSASLGPSWLRQDYESGETQSSIAARWNIDYDQKFYDDLFSLFHKHSLYLPSESPSAYLFDAESGIRVPIRGGFSATAGWDLNINNDPAPGTDKSDSIYSLKFGYEW